MDYAIIGSVLLVALSVVLFRPDVVYAPVPRVVLFFVLGILLALLAGRQVDAKLQLTTPQLSFVVTGIAAVCIGVVFVLAHVAKPESTTRLYRVVDTHDRSVPVDGDRELVIDGTDKGAVVSCAQENTFVVVFPEQIPSVEVRIEDPLAPGEYYRGTLRYADTTSTLRLGDQLTRTP